VTLAERDDSIEALLFDGPDEPLGIGFGKSVVLQCIRAIGRVSLR